MKNRNIIKALNNKEILNNINTPKETNATETAASSQHIFCSADLWNIQKQVRTAFARRRNY